MLFLLSQTLLGLLFLLHGAHGGASWFQINNGQLLPKIQDADVSVHLPYDFTMLGERVPQGTKIWISSDGFVTIGQEFEGFKKVEFPLTDAKKDPMAIVVFRARMQYRPDETSDADASVVYTKNLEQHVLTSLDSAIRDSVANAEESNYMSKNGFAVSWNKISFFGGDPAHTPYPRNTFQVAVVTDGLSTYAIFNYKTIVWDGGLASGGHAETGIGANNPMAQAGINAGRRQGFTSLEYGDNILDIDKEQASESSGQYIYELSSPTPRPHGCISKRKQNLPLHLSPSSGPMFGGNPVKISNACFYRNKPIRCHFGQQVVSGIYLRPSKAMCYAPPFYGSEQIKFKLSVGGEEVKAKDTFYFASIRERNSLELVDLYKWRSTRPAGKLMFRWNRAHVGGYVGRLSVKLYIYHESDMAFGWKEETTIASDVSNSGSFMFDPLKVVCTERCQHKTLGAIVLEMIDSPDRSHPGRLWSNVGALGWYVNSELTGGFSLPWPDQMCYDWFRKDQRDGSYWLDELEHCPCTKEQALADIGRFIPDPGCNMYSKKSSANCYYHQQAEHCVRSVWPSKPTGAGAQCCYNSQGNLMYADDSIYGSTVDRGHSQGAWPYNAAGHIPALSHWVHDVITYQYCCLWSSLPFTCAMYMQQRPTKDCKLYKAAKIAAIYGESTFDTFDGKSHRLGQPGIYTLVKTSQHSENLNIQARLTKVAGAASPVLTAIAVWSDKSSHVEITLELVNHLKKRTTVAIDGVEKDFTEPSWSLQEYKGLQIWSGGLKPVTDQSNFTITLMQGVGIQVTATRNNLNAIISLPTKMMSHLDRKSLLSGSAFPADAAVGADNSLFHTRPVTYTRIDTDIISPAAAIGQYVRTLQSFSRPVISCGKPVKHGIRKGTIYTAGAETRIQACKTGYKLKSNNRQYKCSSSGSWVPAVTTTCEYIGFPIFDPPKSSTPTTTKPTTTTTTTTTTTSTTTTAASTTATTTVPTTTKATTTEATIKPITEKIPEHQPAEIQTVEAEETTILSLVFGINGTSNSSWNATYWDEAEPLIETTTLWIPVFKEDNVSFPVAMFLTALILFLFLLAAFTYRHKRRYRPTPREEKEADYMMSSTGSMTVHPAATNNYKYTQETLDLNGNSGMKSYRVAVNPEPDQYSFASTSSETIRQNRLGTNMRVDEDEEPGTPMKSYRVAVSDDPALQPVNFRKERPASRRLVNRNSHSNPDIVIQEVSD